MLKAIENCHSVYLLIEKKKHHEDVISKAEVIINDCDVRIEQLKFEEANQLTIYNFI